MGLCFSLAAVVSCSSGGAEEPAEIKEAVADTDYSITYYWGPPAEDFTEETVLQMKEAGFDTIPLQRFPCDRDALKEAVGLLEKYGLYAAVSARLVTDNPFPDIAVFFIILYNALDDLVNLPLRGLSLIHIWPCAAGCAA